MTNWCTCSHHFYSHVNCIITKCRAWGCPCESFTTDTQDTIYVTCDDCNHQQTNLKELQRRWQEANR